VQYKNKYVFHGRISEDKFRELVRLFAIDIDAERVSILANLNRNTVNRYFMKFRERIAEICDRDSPFPKGEFEVDESYFGPRRVRGKRGRGAGKKTPVFGILKREGKVYTRILPDCTRDTLVKIIRGKVGLESIIHSDSWHSYDSLVDVGYEKHFRVNHVNNEFALKSNHINGIESFWSYAKHRLIKFHGIAKHTFYLHLKECEWRFNLRNNNLYDILMKEFRDRPLK
jgi:transposase-like protein